MEVPSINVVPELIVNKDYRDEITNMLKWGLSEVLLYLVRV